MGDFQGINTIEEIGLKQFLTYKKTVTRMKTCKYLPKFFFFREKEHIGDAKNDRIEQSCKTSQQLLIEQIAKTF